jgi:hypothetical protein
MTNNNTISKLKNILINLKSIITAKENIAKKHMGPDYILNKNKNTKKGKKIKKIETDLLIGRKNIRIKFMKTNIIHLTINLRINKAKINIPKNLWIGINKQKEYPGNCLTIKNKIFLNTLLISKDTLTSKALIVYIPKGNLNL